MSSDVDFVFVIGGSGFVGSAMVRKPLAGLPWNIVNVDKLTCAASSEVLAGACGNPRCSFEQIDTIERRQSLGIACVEQTAWSPGRIDDARMEELATVNRNSGYGQYLGAILNRRR